MPRQAKRSPLPHSSPPGRGGRRPRVSQESGWEAVREAPGEGKSPKKAEVAVIMGSASDWETMKHAVEMLKRFGIMAEHRIVSAHRTPELLAKFGKEAAGRGLRVIIAGAGGAAHLPGMIAAHTWLPVLGVPILTKALKGIDSLLSIAQMPAGVAVGTLAIGEAGAKNAGLLASSIIGLSDANVRKKVENFRKKQTETVLAQKLP
jgi:5-(carboxyamino)imidazole ribonucleotide mutase